MYDTVPHIFVFILNGWYDFDSAWWRRQIETFPRYWPLVRGIHLYFPHKDQWRRALVFSLICAWTNGWEPLLSQCVEVCRSLGPIWGGWGCEVSCGGHHQPRGKTTTGSALDGAVFDIAQILAYLVHDMSRSQFFLGFGHFGWLPSFFGQ